MKTDKVDVGALRILRSAKRYLTTQQYKTIRGQVLAGDPDGAMKGLRKIMNSRAGGTT